jgi:hypothetical protein
MMLRLTVFLVLDYQRKFEGVFDLQSLPVVSHREIILWFDFFGVPKIPEENRGILGMRVDDLNTRIQAPDAIC